jgi:hypothetical protein
MMIARRATIAVGVLFLFVMSELLAQTNVTGYISGRVVNKVSEAVEGAQVTAVRVKTGIRRTIVTSAEGGFRFAALPVGEYTLMIEAEGFQSAERGYFLNGISSAPGGMAGHCRVLIPGPKPAATMKAGQTVTPVRRMGP